MIRVLGTVFAALMGLAFGSFLNVCLTRWPAGESIVKPRSHCRNCGRTLAWWENVPLLSWLALRGRCRTCRTWIGWRYSLVEAAISALWATVAWRFLELALDPDVPAISRFLHYNVYNDFSATMGKMIFFWLLIALAALDLEHLWLPDWLTLPGITLGVIFSAVYRSIGDRYSDAPSSSTLRIGLQSAFGSAFAILAAAGLILLIRWIYKLIRHHEGLGLGDAKLMAMLAAWLGLPGALLSFAIGVVLGSLAGIVVLTRNKGSESWATTKLPLGTFLCIGGVVSSLWGQPIIAAYVRWAGF